MKEKIDVLLKSNQKESLLNNLEKLRNNEKAVPSED